jgi:uncharacterized membrane protein YkoI
MDNQSGGRPPIAPSARIRLTDVEGREIESELELANDSWLYGGELRLGWTQWA